MCRCTNVSVCVCVCSASLGYKYKVCLCYTCYVQICFPLFLFISKKKIYIHTHGLSFALAFYVAFLLSWQYEAANRYICHLTISPLFLLTLIPSIPKHIYVYFMCATDRTFPTWGCRRCVCGRTGVGGLEKSAGIQKGSLRYIARATAVSAIPINSGPCYCQQYKILM